MENNKSQAEIYREERKARLEKEAQRKAKKSPKISKTKKLIGKVIAIVLAVAIGIGALGGILNFFGVPQKIIKIKVADDTTCSFTVAEFNFFYFNVWNNLCSTAEQYAYYGMDMGFDYNKSPEAQEITKDIATTVGLDFDALGVEKPTWADAIRYLTINQLVEIKYLAAQAEKEGLTLSDTDKSEIETAIESYRTTAKKSDYSLDRWLRTQIGNGVTEKVFRAVYEDQLLANKYYEKFEADTSAAITADDINSRYNSEKDHFDIVDVRFYSFTAEAVKVSSDATEEEEKAALDKANADAKAKADAFLANVKDEASFISEAKKAILTEDNKSTKDPDEVTNYDAATYAELEQMSEEAAKWVYDDARQVGDKTVIDFGNGTYGVFYVVTVAHKDMSTNAHDVRHILISFPTDEETGATKKLTDSEKSKYKAKAQEILDEYLKNPTEENFAALAKSKTEDSGSKETGGLYEGLNSSTNFVQPFKDWYLAEGRKAGDTGIIESDYGYHIMYYSKGSGVTWEETVKTAILNEKVNTYYTEKVDVLFDSVNINSLAVKWAVSAEVKHIEKLLAYSASNSSNSNSASAVIG